MVQREPTALASGELQFPLSLGVISVDDIRGEIQLNPAKL